MGAFLLHGARWVAIVLLACVLSIAIDPYIGFDSSATAIAVNSVLPALLVLLLCGITGRVWMALLAEILVLELLCFADQAKVTYLSSNVVYADLTVLGDLLREPRLVMGFIHVTAAQVACGVLAILALVGACLFLRKRLQSWLPAPLTKPLRLVSLFVAIVGLGIVGTHRVPDSIGSLHWEVFSQLYDTDKVGITGNLLLGKMTARSIKRKPDDAAIQAFWREPAVKSVLPAFKGGSDLRPDIVVVQSESLFEPSLLCGFPDQPVLKHVAAQRQGGRLHVPVFGGRTLQTEFEVQSGVPIDAYPGSMFAYYELVTQPFAALPAVLDTLGYRTLAIHPGNRGFWRRSKAMGDMGFDAFEGIGAFLYPRDYSDRGHVRDAALMRAVLAELDAANGPTYITAITMDNHFPYGGVGAPANDHGLGMPSALDGDARREMADYLVHAIDADNAYGFLLEALKRRGRPTLVLFYGDHMPPLGHVYGKLCFKDGKRPEEHFPPFRVWANYPLPEAPAETVSYLLPGWLMHAAGLPLDGAMLANAVAGAVVNDPVTDGGTRRRVLEGYANIAVASLAKPVPSPPVRGQIFMGREHALGVLMGLAQPGKTASIAEKYNDLYFPEPRGAEVEFALDGGVTSLSLRPYLGIPELECMHANAGARAEFDVEADGKTLYRASVTAQTVRLATLELQGVKRLKFWAKSDRAGACGQTHVRIARMRCYSTSCMGGERPDAGSVLVRPSRMLASDPADGDIDALGMMVPEAVRLAGEDKPAMSWLMTQESARQDGFSPIALESDYRLFMPPPDKQSAWVDFNVSAVDEIAFTPRIKKLTPECVAMNAPGQEGGVAGLTLLLDGKPALPRLIVDRNYHGVVTIETGGAQTLRVSVDKGNDVSWCDWFGIGVERLKVKGSVDASGARLPDVTASYRAIPPAAEH